MPYVRTNRLWHLTEPRQFEQAYAALPALSDGWIQLRMQYCGLCGSDISQYRGRRKLVYPHVLGHEFVGIVNSVGPNVKNVKLGDVVVSDLNYRCGMCMQCIRGRSHLCVERGAGRFTNRGFAASANIDASYVHPIFDQQLHPRLTLVEPLSCALHALDWADPQRCDPVLVVGAGSIGLCMALALLNRELECVQYWDPCTARLSAISSCSGQEFAVGPPRRKAYEVVLDVSGTLDGLYLACDSVRDGGTLCTMSHLDGEISNELLSKLTRTDVRFKVSYLNGEREAMSRAAGIIAKLWNARFDDAVGIHDVENVPEVFLERGRSTKNKEIFDITAWSRRL